MFNLVKFTVTNVYHCYRYNANLTEARDQGVKKAFVNGITMGIVWMVIFGAYGLGFWYGGKLARDEPENYSIGDVMIVSVPRYLGNHHVVEYKTSVLELHSSMASQC